MGNCLNHEFSSTVWAGDDWCSIDPGHHDEDDEHFDEDSIDNSNMERNNLLGVKKDTLTKSYSLSSRSCTTAVKIKISKRQLEELMSRAERLGLTAEQVAIRLMKYRERHEGKHHHHHHWKPNLQSIPEMN